MNNQKIKIATLNVKGLNDLSKRQKTFTLLKSYKFDIILLQETNLTNTKHVTLSNNNGVITLYGQIK